MSNLRTIIAFLLGATAIGVGFTLLHDAYVFFTDGSYPLGYLFTSVAAVAILQLVGAGNAYHIIISLAIAAVGIVAFVGSTLLTHPLWSGAGVTIGLGILTVVLSLIYRQLKLAGVGAAEELAERGGPDVIPGYDENH